MSNLEKIQKGMRIFQILTKIVLIFACVGLVLTSVAAILVAAGVLTAENQFLHFLSAAAEMSKGQLTASLTAAACSLLLGGACTAYAYRYFTLELKEGTPFTNAGANRIRQLGILTVVLSFVSTLVRDVLYEAAGLPEWSRADFSGGIVPGILLILLAVVVRYGAELEEKSKGR